MLKMGIVALAVETAAIYPHNGCPQTVMTVVRYHKNSKNL